VQQILYPIRDITASFVDDIAVHSDEFEYEYAVRHLAEKIFVPEASTLLCLMAFSISTF